MTRKTKTRRVLDGITADEGLAVLRTLLRRHPDLTAEAEAIAATFASEVDRHSVAEDIVDAVGMLGFEELNARAGRQAYGYVEPGEAAWEILEEVVEPGLDEIKRLLSIGLEDPARAQCEGILLGLFAVQTEHLDNDVVQYAEDFPAEAAARVLEAWLTGPGGSRTLDDGLLRDGLGEWAEFLLREQRRINEG